MNDPRQRILRRLNEALSNEPQRGRPQVPLPRVHSLSNDDRDHLLRRFSSELEKLSVTWEVTESPIAARLRLAGRLQDEGLQAILSWTADQLPIDGLLDALQVLGIATICPELQGVAGHERELSALEKVHDGLIAAEAGIAATGTLVWCNGPGRSPLVSQLTRRLLVLLPASRVFATLEDWLPYFRAEKEPAKTLTVSRVIFLTGPSRSLDIELLPATGVHGPKRLHVIIVQGL